MKVLKAVFSVSDNLFEVYFYPSGDIHWFSEKLASEVELITSGFVKLSDICVEPHVTTISVREAADLQNNSPSHWDEGELMYNESSLYKIRRLKYE